MDFKTTLIAFNISGKNINCFFLGNKIIGRLLTMSSTEIKKENHFFWNKLEEDLKYSLPYHVKNVLHVNGYSNPYSMMTLNDDRINNVQLVVQTELIAMLETECSQCDVAFDERDKVYFFGPFASTTDKFRFLPGERALIDAYVLQVTKIMEKDGIKYFKTPDNYKILRKDTVDLAFGLYFGEKRKSQPAKKQQTLSIPSIENLTSDLVIRLTEMRRKFVENNNSCSNFDVLACNIKVVNNGIRVKASLNCSICHSMQIDKTLHVQYDISKNNSAAYWNVSNVLKHLRLHAKKQATSNNNNKDNRDKLMDETIKKTENSHRSTVEKAEGRTTIDKNENESSIVSLNNSASDSDISGLIENYENLLYQQISKQNLFLMESNLTNNPKTKMMKFNIANQCQNVRVVVTKGDGNCLFSSLVHQLFQFKLNSNEHEDAVSKLRADVVNFIKSNLEEFKLCLKWRISPSGKVADIDSECEKFLNSVLSVDYNWGGAETLMAVSKMYKANIMVFKEHDNHSLNTDFNPEFERTLLLAYRQYNSTENSNDDAKNSKNVNRVQRNHYDSVFEVHPEILMDLVKITAKIEANKAKIKRIIV